jgi:hypothetical protein
MLKLGDVAHVTVAVEVNEKYQPAGVLLSGRRVELAKTGKPDGAPVWEPIVIDAPPPFPVAGTVLVPLNPPDAGMTSVPPFDAIVTVHGFAAQGADVETPPGGVASGVLEQPPIASAPRALSKKKNRNDGTFISHHFLRIFLRSGIDSRCQARGRSSFYLSVSGTTGALPD